MKNLRARVWHTKMTRPHVPSKIITFVEITLRRHLEELGLVTDETAPLVGRTILFDGDYDARGVHLIGLDHYTGLRKLPGRDDLFGTLLSSVARELKSHLRTEIARGIPVNLGFIVRFQADLASDFVYYVEVFW